MKILDDTNDTPKEELGVTSEGEDYKTSPKFSKSFLEYMEETFDIRKSVHYCTSTDYLKGVQSVLDHMKYLYENNYRL